MLRSICVFVLLLAGLASGAETGHYAFVWKPTTSDVGTPDSRSYKVLHALLLLLHTEHYTVQPADSVDFIIRKRFLVSSSFRNAYNLYQHRIFELNPGLSETTALTAGSSILLPVGPKYSATELADQRLPSGVQGMLFTRLAQSAYSARSAESALTIARRDLKRYVSPNIAQPPADLDRRIKNRGIVSALAIQDSASRSLTLLQTYDFEVQGPSQRTELSGLSDSDPTSLFPGIVPMAASQPSVCQPCSTCSKLLKIPPNTDISRARILVEDTGVTFNVPPGKAISLSDSKSIIDDSPDFHGTFVYSEIVAPTSGSPLLQGVIPAAQVYVAKAALKTKDGSFAFTIKDIVDSWQQFAALVQSDRASAQTSVVNLSAAGPVPSDSMLPNAIAPQLPNGDNILVVAAAGNRPNQLDPVQQLFGRLSNEGATLLVVGATAQDGSKAAYSSWNQTHVQVFGRGDCVCGTPGQIDGTSQAAPIVATAAAILASSRPSWNAHQVMWRLISTADSTPLLVGKSVTGEINLPNALQHAIIVTPNDGAPPSLPSKITFDASWAAEMQRLAQSFPKQPVLKIFNGRPAGPNVCFDALMWMNYIPQTICVLPTAQVQLGDQPTGMSANRIQDIDLPLPTDRDPSLSLPGVAFSLDGSK
jgi:hypothetical protein